jgi:DNA-binding transcriptional ArsR family regulator
MTDDPAGDVFAALADGTRRRIVYELSADGPLTPTRLASRLGLTRQTVSKHLAALATARLVVVERSGREARCRLTPEPFAQAEAWMRAIGATWDLRLAALARHLATG